MKDMDDDIVEEEGSENVRKIEEMFEAPTLGSRLRKLFKGLASKPGTREYREGMIELQRLAAPACAVLFPTLFAAVLFVCTIPSAKDKTLRDIQVVQADEQTDVDDAPDDTPPDTEIETTDIDITTDVSVDVQVENPAQALAPTAPVPQVMDVNAVLDVKSPVVFKGAFANARGAEARAKSLRHFGGNVQTEAAVMRALRWLKQRQSPDGSWPGAPGADNMRPTGLVILTFLSHGEKPGGSKEFGFTVQKGVEYLMKKQSLDAAEIHALAESFGMARNPNVRDAVEKKLNDLADRLADTQWGPPADGSKNVLPRLLPMTFQTMALRSAKLSKFKVPNMEKALAKLKQGFMCQANLKLGGFSDDHWGPPGVNYRRTGTWHFMVGVVAMQYLGLGGHSVIEKTLSILDDDWEPPTLSTTDIACCPVRGNYWATMVFFNAGGKRWANWNRDMIRVYVGGQHIVKDAKYLDPKGKEREIGYWTCEDMHISRDKPGREIITTCYIAQQLMVYYRYLPTSAKEVWDQVEEDVKAAASESDDVQVGIGDL